MKSLLTTKPFTAIDGEGITIGRNHYYNLITARSTDLDLTINYAASGRELRLTTWQILDFLRRRLSQFREQKSIFVMFSFDYDITKWLEDLTHEQLAELYHTTKIYIQSPDGIDYKITYFRRKFFTLEFIYYEDGQLKPTAITIYDVFSFFGTSFVKALEQWGFTVPEFLKDMKDARGDFNKIESQMIVDYNTIECELLCQLMNKVRKALYAENIRLSKWHGSGAVAQKLLEITNSKTAIAVSSIRDNIDLESALMGSYFGGRFELFRKGIVEHTYQYDINSAYPYAMSTLPNLEGCRIQFRNEYTTEPYSIWFVKYNVLDHGTKRKIYNYANAQTFLAGPFPYRTKEGSILYPYYNPYGVWIHQIELQTAIELYGRDCFQIQYGYSLIPTSDNIAFPFISELAAKRLVLKQQGDERNIVLKLALNSLYGKTAQGQRQIGVIPPFQNYYIAGYITAFTRAKLLKESFHCGSFGKGIIQFATDGIFSMDMDNNIKHSSSDFGSWEATDIPVPICYIQGGVYYSEKKSQKQKRRTRGFRADSLDAEDVFNAWRDFYYSRGVKPSFITASENRFHGIGTTIATNRWHEYGRFIKSDRSLTFFTPTKQFANLADEFLIGKDEWEYMNPKIKGITKGEMLSHKEYVLMIPDKDLVEGVSKEYTPINLKDPSNIPDNIMQMIIENIQMGEQPDYYSEEILELEW